MAEIKRIAYLDYIRIIACFAVIVIHVCGAYYDDYPAESVHWKLLLALDGAVKWAVPVFVMISGSVVLGRGYTKEKIKKAAARFAVIYIVWAIVYSLCSFNRGERIRDMITTLILGDVHMWFLPMIFGLYLLIPILDRLIESEMLTKYYLVLWFVVGIFLPTAVRVLKIIYPYAGKVASSFTDHLGLQFVMGYSGYFVLGKYLERQKNINKRFELSVYGLCILVYFLNVGFAIVTSSGDAKTDWMPITSCIQAVAVYLLGRRLFAQRPVKPFAEIIVKNSFGIYLVHFMLVDLATAIIPVDSISGGGLILVTLFIAIIVFVLSNIVIYFIKKCPFIRNIV